MDCRCSGCSYFIYQFMFWCKHQKVNTENGIGAGGVNFDGESFAFFRLTPIPSPKGEGGR